MRLFVQELESSVEQGFKPIRNTILKAIRPHLYIHNHPTGDLKIQLCQSDGTLISESEPISISDINTEDEYHGYVTFYVNGNLKANTNYLFRLVGINGYSFDEAAYCGVCTDYDLRKYEPDSELVAGFSPLDFEMWSLSKK